jgi:competence protein ComEC
MLIIYLGVSWLLGIWLASLLGLDSSAWLILAGLAAVFALLLRRDPAMRLLLACVVAFSLGGWRFQASVPALDESHVAYYNDADNVTISGRVIEEPADRDTAAWLRVAVDSITLEGGVSRAAGGLLHVVTDALSAADYGASLILSGRLFPSDFWRREHVYSEMRYPEISVRTLSVDESSDFYSTTLRLKEQARQTINRLLPFPESVLLIGILLGDDSGLPKDLAADFRTTGMTHIIAISGFNIALLVGLVDVLGAAVLPRRSVALLAIVVVALYTILVGASPSVVRAAFMGAMYLVGRRLLGRPTFPYAPLLAAAVVMTVFNPAVLWDIGFQLSFTATLGLILFVDPLTRWSRAQLSRWLEPGAAGRTIGLLNEGLIVTIAAQILTLPLLIAYFGQWPLLNLPANLLILPAQPAVMILGILTTVSGLIWPALGQVFAWLTWLFLHYTIEMVSFFAAIPGAAVPLRFSPEAIAAIYLLIGGITWLAVISSTQRETIVRLIRRNTPTRVALAGSLAATVLLLNWSLTQPDGYLHVVFLDVDGGEATLVQTPTGRQILINGGRSPDTLGEQLGKHLSFWDRSLDLVVVTEPTERLAGGLVEIVDHYAVDRLMTNGQVAEGGTAYASVLDAAEERQTPVHIALAGETIDLGDGTTVQVVGTSAALALRLSYGDFSLLLPGQLDAESAREGLPAIAVKAIHEVHGQALFLQMVRPQVVVVPTETMEQAEQTGEWWSTNAHQAGAAVLFSSEIGAIEVVSDGRRMWWAAERRMKAEG